MALFVCQVPQLSGFKFVRWPYLFAIFATGWDVWLFTSEMLRLPRVLLKYCACDGVVSCQSTAPGTGVSFWNIGPAALRDLLNTPRSPATMLRQCEMDSSCPMLLYSLPQQHCRRGCGGSAARAKTYWEKKCRITWRWGHGGHMVYSLFRKRDGTYRGTKICMCFEVKVPHGACVLILDCRLSWKQWISWLVIIASVF